MEESAVFVLQVEDVMLDASAVLALIQNEPGSLRVAGVLARSMISAVNWTELITKLVQKTNDPSLVLRHLSVLKLRVLPWTETSAGHSARFAHLAARGLSLGDRACISEASLAGIRILTADRRWKEIDEIAGQVDLIR